MVNIAIMARVAMATLGWYVGAEMWLRAMGHMNYARQRLLPSSCEAGNVKAILGATHPASVHHSCRVIIHADGAARSIPLRNEGKKIVMVDAVGMARVVMATLGWYVATAVRRGI